MKPHEEARDEAQIFLQAKYVSSRVFYFFAANISNTSCEMFRNKFYHSDLTANEFNRNAFKRVSSANQRLAKQL